MQIEKKWNDMQWILGIFTKQLEKLFDVSVHQAMLLYKLANEDTSITDMLQRIRHVKKSNVAISGN